MSSIAVETHTGGGISGGSLNAAVRLPAGAPPFAFVLAGWITAARDDAARTAARIVGARDRGHADQVVFPTVALRLFVAGAPGHAGGPAEIERLQVASRPMPAISVFTVRPSSSQLHDRPPS